MQNNGHYLKIRISTITPYLKLSMFHLQKSRVAWRHRNITIPEWSQRSEQSEDPEYAKDSRAAVCDERDEDVDEGDDNQEAVHHVPPRAQVRVRPQHKTLRNYLKETQKLYWVLILTLLSFGIYVLIAVFWYVLWYMYHTLCNYLNQKLKLYIMLIRILQARGNYVDMLLFAIEHKEP